MKTVDGAIVFKSEEFLGTNTYKGFVSLYEGFLEAFLRECKSPFVYVIKGGPGSGKSTFVKKVAALLEENGCDVRMLRCSGDPNSFDGVYSYKGEIMVLDGTAPHCIEVKRAGLDGTILNFGAFWDLNELKKFEKGLGAIYETKKLAYLEAYAYLGALKNMQDVMDTECSECVNESMLCDNVENLLHDIIWTFGVKKGLGRVVKSFATTVTSQGISGGLRHFVGNDFDDFNVIKLKVDDKSFASRELSVISDRLRRCGYDIKEGICGFDGKSLEHVVVPEIKCVFTAGRRFPLTCEDESMSLLFKKACDALDKAGEAHLVMEKYYIDAMDFERLEAFCAEVLDKINKNL